MKMLSFAIAAAALLSLGAIGTAAQAQPFGGHTIQAQVYVVPAPPHRGYYRPAPPPRHYYAPNRYRHGDRRWDNRRGRGDRDRDGVPNRFDRAPNNPYRR
ncbi:hypothetical protein BH11PSE13_BH11PSE13_39130 [soil metagenome]